MTIPGISKSRFTDYLKCPRLGYMSCYGNRFKHLRDPLDWMALHLIGEGNKAGELARQSFPGGCLIGHVFDLDKAQRETKEAMRDPDVTYVFEGAFASEGLLCRVDVLRKLEGGAVDIIEVKAANSVKKEHVPDAGFQLAVLEEAGISVRSVSLMHFDPEYVYPGGGDYDLGELFTVDDITARAREWVGGERDGLLDDMRSGLSRPDPPQVPLKSSCKDCVYYRQACAPSAPEHPVSELGHVRSEMFAALEDAGIEDIRDVPDDFPGLTDGHRLVLQAVRTGQLALDHSGLDDLERELVHPVWFMDFETYMPGLPIYAGTRPWQQIPFQWSLHVQEADGSLRHLEFLKADGSDPRREFAESLIEATGEEGSVVVYNRGMESTRLRELARDLPDLEEPVLAIDARIVDLLAVVRQSCYHVGFHGSRSLKAVTPVLAPHLSYDELTLKAGMQAMQAYEVIVDPATSDAERRELRGDLLQYCALDTLAMVEVLGSLQKLASGREEVGI